MANVIDKAATTMDKYMSRATAREGNPVTNLWKGTVPERSMAARQRVRAKIREEYGKKGKKGETIEQFMERRNKKLGKLKNKE